MSIPQEEAFELNRPGSISWFSLWTALRAIYLAYSTVVWFWAVTASGLEGPIPTLVEWLPNCIPDVRRLWGTIPWNFKRADILVVALVPLLIYAAINIFLALPEGRTIQLVASLLIVIRSILRIPWELVWLGRFSIDNLFNLLSLIDITNLLLATFALLISFQYLHGPEVQAFFGLEEGTPRLLKRKIGAFHLTNLLLWTIPLLILFDRVQAPESFFDIGIWAYILHVLALSRLVRLEYREFHDAWIADGRPFVPPFWFPQEIWKEYRIGKFRTPFRIAFRLCFTTPEWAVGHEQAARLLEFFRLSGLFFCAMWTMPFFCLATG